MRASIILRDVRNGKVEMTTEMEEVTALENKGPPTAASIMMVGAMTLFESGVLAQAGSIALKAMEEGKSPIEAVNERYGNGNTNTR